VEYIDGGSLESLIQELRLGKKTISLKQKLAILMDVANGINYLHTLQPKKCIHRDLKSANILLTNSGVAKLCDFGLSKMFSEEVKTNLTCNIGTIFYIPNVSYCLNMIVTSITGNVIQSTTGFTVWYFN